MVTRSQLLGVLQGGFVLTSEVMPSEMPMDKMDIFAPLPLAADAVNDRGDENYNIIVRLKPGVSVQQAQADIDVIASPNPRERQARCQLRYARGRVAGTGGRGCAPCAAGAARISRRWCC